MFGANIYAPLDGGMVTLQICRFKFSHKDSILLKLNFTIWGDLGVTYALHL